MDGGKSSASSVSFLFCKISGVKFSGSPFSPAIIDVKFPTFTNKNRKIPKFIDINDPETILKVGINPKGFIYVIAHGFLESGDRPWVSKLTFALLDYDKDATVIVVDWKGEHSTT